MWKGPTEGPEGGGPSDSASSQELKNKIEQSSTMPTSLMPRNTDVPSAMQIKAAEYAEKLSKINARVKKNKKRKDDSESSTNIKNVETPTRENIRLLQQQLEENKLKLVERDKNQKGMEDMVTQLKAQLDDSQHLISQTPINISLIEDRVDYNPNTSSQELYNILLNKDKRNNDLTMKISKLEANILDLQENIKEKDQVIDARTKAITLMSENLSRKGKTTLDALDDTKEQMRKMQKTFISMEEEIKAEKQKLLQELNEKTVQIIELTSLNENLTTNNSQLSEELLLASNSEDVDKLKHKIQELENKLENIESPRNSPSRTIKRGKKNKSQHQTDDNSTQLKELEKIIEDNKKIIQENLVCKDNHEKKINDLENIIKELKSSADSVEKSPKHESSTDKLKKQLDENNKNMIKVKAQHKTKIKELNMKIDAFKKIGDVNAEVVRLEAENSKLSQKVAELEEEKGNMQLSSMGESKDSINLEDLKDLENKINASDAEISALKQQNEENELKISTLTEKLDNISTTNNTQVSSDLNSVQFEEQMEKMETEQITIIKDKQTQIDQLWDQISILKKEKTELSIKMDTYMQENIELIDRLEKLSTEKVSSAESIEIVESLTQQEKLELQAYQKSSGVKSEEMLEENPELSESVTQLTEETSELLQKIELFTVERREVMEKMEFLRSENNQLLLKNKEIENNRDVLIETYEQLQTEKEYLSNAFDAIKKTKSDSEDLSEEIKEFKSLVDIQKQEMRELQLKLLSQEKSVQENGNLLEKIDNLERELEENLKLKDEVENYKLILEDNKNELISSADLIASLQNKLQEKSDQWEYYRSEVDHLNSVITDLNSAISKLEEENEANVHKSESVVIMSYQLDELKAALNENIEQAQDYEKELEGNSTIIKSQNLDLKQLNNKILEFEYALETKDEQLKTQKDESQAVIGNLERLIKEKDTEFRHIFDELKEKCANLQKHIESNSITTVETKIQQLETKNKEQLEKMKKIAANLKKKSAQCTELEQKNVEIIGKWETETKETEELKTKCLESDNKLREYESQQINLTEELGRIKQNHDDVIEKNQELSNQILQYQGQLEDLQNISREYETQINTLTNENEIIRSSANNISNVVLTEKDDLIQTLTESIKALEEQLQASKYLHETSANALQMKIHELESFIETQDGELVNYKNRVDKLEEGLSSVETRRLSLEHRAIQLGAELQAKEMNYEEAAQNGDYLEKRLAALADHDLLVEKRLSETMQENQEFSDRNNLLMQQMEEIKSQLNVAVQELHENQEKCKLVDNFESNNAELQNTVIVLKDELKRAQTELNSIKLEMEKNENEMQEQMQQYTDERKLLTEQCEVLRDQIKQNVQTHEELNQEIFDVKQKLEQQETDFEENIEKYHIIEVDYKKSLAYIETLNTQLNNLKMSFDEKCDEFRKLQDVDNSAQLLNNKLVDSEKEKEILKLKLTENKDELFETHNQLLFAKNMMKQIEENNLETLGRNDAYERRIIDLVKEIEATKLSSYKDENTIKWPNSIDQTFPFFEQPIEKMVRAENTHEFPLFELSSHVNVNSPVEEALPVENSQQELLQKIKTLEFMLYSVEKEKDNALLQCHELSNELTTLVYERENKIDPEILTNDEIIKMQENLRKIEFTDCQRLSGADDSGLPVVEELCIAKSSYLCEPEATTSTSTTVLFGENDDGWAWGPEEAKLEQEHMQKVEATPENQQLGQFEETIRVLELKQANNLEELKQAQIKSGKLIKKLKEFKAKNEQLTLKLKLGDFGDLNEAIVDELKAQITALEKKIKETNVDLDKEKLEKNNLLKRIDVLTAANERMIEMKEKQDVEVLAWQHRNRELSSKLEQFEWGKNDFDDAHDTQTKQTLAIENDPELLTKITELKDTIKDLSLDNEDLQVLLEEQRNLRLSAEKSKSMEPIAENMKSEAEYNVLLQEKLELSAELVKVQEKLKEVSQQLQINYTEKTLLEASILENTITIEDLNRQILEFNYDIEYLKQKREMEITEPELVGELKQKLDILQTEKTAMSNKNDTLCSRVNFINDAMMLLEEEKDDFVNQIENLMDIVNTLKADNVILQDKMNEIIAKKEEELKSLHHQIAQKDKELIKFEEVLIAKESEFQIQISATVEEWSQHVEQRGNDVAESWKLHLESRENEFTQSEQLLRKEIIDLEERCKAYESITKSDNIDKSQEIQQLIEKNEFNLREIRSKDEIIVDLKAQISLGKDNCEELLKLRSDLAETASLQCLNQENLDVYRKKIEANELTCISLQEVINQKELLITELNRKLDELRSVNVEFSIMQQQLVDCKQQDEVHSAQLQENQLNLQELTQEIEHMQQIVQNKEVEISNLNALLREKETDFEYSLQSKLLENEAVLNERLKEYDLMKYRLNESELRHDDSSQAKDAELEAYRVQLYEFHSQNNELQTQLETKERECTEMENKLQEFGAICDDKSKHLSDFQAIIEDQVLKIEELQVQLYEKSGDYDALIAELDIRQHSRRNSPTSETQTSAESEKHVHFEQVEQEKQPETLHDNIDDPVSRAELDLALYMLHQRDVRCEELTVELMSLLEERDTLQLRLSNAIREKEQFRCEADVTLQSASSSFTAQGAIPKSKAIILGATGTEMASEATESIASPDGSLANKLSELKTIGYRRDKTLLDAQDLRRIQQLSFLQQHKEEMSKLPPEAAARLVDASYTLSRDVQSPSKVLLNWLWGKSTPKEVNNI